MPAPSINPGATGSLLVRYDAFATRRSTGGARLGFSVWGAFHTPPSSTWTGEATRSFEQMMPMYRSTSVTPRWAFAGTDDRPPARSGAPISADVGFGFGRVDLDASPWGRTALPALTFEAGLRHKVPVDRLFVTWTARGSWIETPAREWMAGRGVVVRRIGPCIGYGMRTGAR